jgi:predicted amidohydrolase YtcJ
MTRSGATILIRNVAAGGRSGVDVRAGAEVILAVGRSLSSRPGEQVLDGAGGALIPGLHDHHVHLRAAVAARQSADVSAAASPAGFDQIVATAAAAAGRGWLRVVGWDENAAGPLDRYRLDSLAGPAPVRVQHRSGAMWVLSSAALAQAGAESCQEPGAERDEQGRLTGRLLRMDSWLRDRIPVRAPDAAQSGLAEYAAGAARLGVTGFTDATPGRDAADAADFARLSAAGTLPQRLVLMGPPGLPVPATSRVTPGPVKIILDDATLPGLTELSDAVAAAHRAGVPVALHCVTAGQLAVAVAALEEAGPAGDRIEHAGIVPPGFGERLAGLGVAVVTQPGFIAARGDSYLRQVPLPERDWLYPCASLIRAGVSVAAGTDAPFGPADPWACMAAAVTRRTRSGRIAGSAERVTALRALRLFLAAADDVRQLRSVAPGQPADVCLLRVPLPEALRRPSADAVRATIMGGAVYGT